MFAQYVGVCCCLVDFSLFEFVLSGISVFVIGLQGLKLAAFIYIYIIFVVIFSFSLSLAVLEDDETEDGEYCDNNNYNKNEYL